MLRTMVFLAAACAVPAFLSTGCVSDAAQAMKVVLQEPAVQATLQRWEAEADVTNPEIGFYLVNGGVLKSSGFIARGKLSGDPYGGISPELLRDLVEIANERRAAQGKELLALPATQPAG